MNIITSVPNPHGNDQHSPGFVEDTGDIITGPLELSDNNGLKFTTWSYIFINGEQRILLKDTAGDGMNAILVINTEGVLFPAQYTTVLAPTYQIGGQYYDTILHKLRVGGAADWESIITEKSLFINTLSVQTLTGAGAVDLTSNITHIVTSGAGADAVTLADGAEGQHKTIIMKTITTGGDTSVITPAHFANGTTITGNSVGDIQNMLFTNGAWHWTGGRGAVIA